jgi:hypothetical protein
MTNIAPDVSGSCWEITIMRRLLLLMLLMML